MGKGEFMMNTTNFAQATVNAAMAAAARTILNRIDFTDPNCDALMRKLVANVRPSEERLVLEEEVASEFMDATGVTFGEEVEAVLETASLLACATGVALPEIDVRPSGTVHIGELQVRMHHDWVHLTMSMFAAYAAASEGGDELRSAVRKMAEEYVRCCRDFRGEIRLYVKDEGVLLSIPRWLKYESLIEELKGGGSGYYANVMLSYDSIDTVKALFSLPG